MAHVDNGDDNNGHNNNNDIEWDGFIECAFYVCACHQHEMKVIETYVYTYM